MHGIPYATTLPLETTMPPQGKTAAIDRAAPGCHTRGQSMYSWPHVHEHISEAWLLHSPNMIQELPLCDSSLGR